MRQSPGQSKSAVALNILFLAAAVLFSHPSVRAELLPVKTYLSSDGLIYEKIYSIYQDSRGFIWFTSSIGMSRFDGYNFVNYGLENGLGLLISDTIEDADGVYWFASDGDGVYRFDPRAGIGAGSAKPVFEKISISDERGANGALKFFKTRGGEILVGTNAGVFTLNPAEKKFSRVEMNLPRQPAGVTTFAEDADGNLWIGHQLGLSRRLPDGAFAHYEVLPNGKTDFVRSLAVDKENRVWMVTDKRHLVVFNPEAASAVDRADTSSRKFDYRPENKMANNLAPNSAYQFTAEESLGDGVFRFVYAAADGAVWLAAFERGLIEFDGRGFRLYTKANGLSDNSVLNIAEDNFGNLWVGSNWGAMRINRKSFVTYQLEDGLASTIVTGMLQDRAGAFYVATPNWNLHRLDGNRFTNVKLNLPASVGSYLTDRIMADHAGDWWFATGDGLYRFGAVDKIENLPTAKPAAIYKKENGLPTDRVRVVYEDSRRDVWISFEDKPGHLTRWSRTTGEFQTFTKEAGIPDACVPQLFREDAAGNLYFPCYSKHVVIFSEGRFTALSDDSFSKPVWISDIFVDRRGRLWIATPTQGLVRVENPLLPNPQLKVYTPANGLSMLNTLFLTEDRDGKIYCETANGLDVIEPESEKINHYTIADGLSGTGNGLALRDRNGDLWFGAHRGVSKFTPQATKQFPPPPIYIGNLRAGGKSVPISAVGETEIKNLTLEADAKQMQIDFFGLALATGETLRYQYKLEGADADWSEPSNERTANYPNIPAGDYRFLVRAVNSDGAASERPATISFTVLRPVWQRWWFLLLAALATSAAIYALYRYRVEQIIKLERVRTRIATDLHDDIGSSLSKIAILSEVARRKNGAVKDDKDEPLEIIANTSREMVDSMSDIVWAINPERDNLTDLIQRMRRFAEDILDAQDIGYQFIAPEHLRELALGADVRRDVYLIFKECVNNLAKYAEACEAVITVKLENNFLIIEIADDGCGFDVGRKLNGDGANGFGGNGLKNMQRRAKNFGGAVNIESEIGVGTCIVLQIPVERKFFAV